MSNTPTAAREILIQKISAELVTRIRQTATTTAKTVQPAPIPVSPSAPQPVPDAHRPVQMGAAERTLQHYLASGG